jgi:hypothetical protein
MYSVESICLGHLRETNEASANTEAGTLAGSVANRRGEQVQDGEHGSGNETEENNLFNLEATLAGNELSSQTNGETLNQILYKASDYLVNIKRHHGSTTFQKKMT